MSNEKKLNFRDINEAIAHQNNELYNKIFSENELNSLIEQITNRIKESQETEVLRYYLNREYKNTELQQFYLEKYNTYVLSKLILSLKNYQD
jgi:hypothetical protein